MKFHETSRCLCLKTDTLGVGLGAGILKVGNGVNCGHDNVQGQCNYVQLLLPAKFYQMLSGATAT